MTSQIGEELAYIQSKTVAESMKVLGQGALKILEELLKKASQKNEKLKGGECNLKKLIDSKCALNQIKLDEKYLKDLAGECKRYSTPVAVMKTINDEFKVLFKAEDTEIINSIIQDLITKQLKENTKEVDGITITRSSTEDKVSFKDQEGKEFIGSIKDKAETVKGLQENLGLKPRKALELYLEATKVELKEINVTKLKSKNKVHFKDDKGREYTASLDSKKETIINGIKRTFGLDDKEAEKLYNKATKQSIRSKLADIANKQKTGPQQQKEITKDKVKDRGDR